MTQQTFYPVANSVGPTQVRETEDAYIIEDVPIVRPMELAGGYVPEQSVRETAGEWDGVPATLNHPRDDRGQPVAANRQPETHLGVGEETYYDGTHVRGNIRVKKYRLDEVDGEASDIRRALENGEQIDVSSQYAAEPLSPGVYDGEHRSNVERITRPDSIALLPNKTGVCSIEDGCGINPQLAANADVRVPMTANKYDDKDMDAAAEAQFSAGDLVRWSTSDSPGTGRVAEVVVEPGATVSAEGADVTREATEDEPAYKLDDYVGPEAGYDEGVVVKSASEIIGAWDDAPDGAMSANMEVPDEYRFDNPGEAVEKAQEMGFDGAGDEIIHTHESDSETVFMPAPSHEALVEKLDGDMAGNSVAAAIETIREAVWGADDGEQPEDPPAAANAADDGGDPDVAREELIDEITANSPLTRAALDARCNEGLQAIHSDIMAATANAVGDDSWSAKFRYFRLVAPQEEADRYDSDVLGVGAKFPKSGVYVEWHTEAYPDELDHPHVSEYGSMADLRQATGDEVVDFTRPRGEAVGNTGISDNNDTDTDMSNNSDTDDGKIELDDLSANARGELVDEAVERIEANREDEQKEAIVSEIIANSADYDSDDRETLLEAPIEVLRDLKPTGAAATVPGAGATANAQPDTSGGSSADEYPDGTIGGDL